MLHVCCFLKSYSPSNQGQFCALGAPRMQCSVCSVARHEKQLLTHHLILLIVKYVLDIWGQFLGHCAGIWAIVVLPSLWRV